MLLTRKEITEVKTSVLKMRNASEPEHAKKANAQVPANVNNLAQLPLDLAKETNQRPFGVLENVCKQMIVKELGGAKEAQEHALVLASVTLLNAQSTNTNSFPFLALAHSTPNAVGRDSATGISDAMVFLTATQPKQTRR